MNILSTGAVDAGVIKAQEYGVHERPPKSEIGKRVREFYPVDDDALPVIEWNIHQDSIWLESNSVAAWMNKHHSMTMKQSLVGYYEAKARNEGDCEEWL